jgi:hypothetical protein
MWLCEIIFGVKLVDRTRSALARDQAKTPLGLALIRTD